MLLPRMIEDESGAQDMGGDEVAGAIASGDWARLVTPGRRARSGGTESRPSSGTLILQDGTESWHRAAWERWSVRRRSG